MKKKWIWVVVIIALLFSLLIGMFFVTRAINSRKNDNGETIVKDNVYVISNETDWELQPIEVTDNQLVFTNNPKYKKGQIIVSGIIDSAPDGFIRRVIKTEQVNGQYMVKTESAVLTDVFEQAHITKKFELTETGVVEVDNLEDNNEQSGNQSEKQNKAVQFQNVSSSDEYSFLELTSTNKKTNSKNTKDDKEEETEYQFGKSFEEELGENVKAYGEVGTNVGVDVDLDISHGDIIFQIVAHNETDGILRLNFEEEISGKYEKDIFEHTFPNIQFFVGGIPIVVTNDMAITVSGSAELKGSIGLSYEVQSQNRTGIKYDSRKRKPQEIKEHKNTSDGLEWSAVKVEGSSSADIFIHLLTKLYGSTGTDIAVGVAGKAEGEAKVSVNENLEGYAGKMDMEIGPVITGTLVVSVPVIDKKLAEQPLFTAELPSFWEKHWTSSDNWKKDYEEQETGLEKQGIFGLQGGVYTTRYSEENAVTCPTFQFDVPNGWSVTNEDIDNPAGLIDEHVVLTNGRGTTISYWSCERELGGESRNMVKGEVSKVAESDFIPSIPSGTNMDLSGLGNFMVAKVKVVGQLDMNLDSDYTAVDGETFYAVLPESFVGEREYVQQQGNVDEFSFDYPTPHAFIAVSPDGNFTDDEEKDIIEILKSFKITDI